MQCINGIYLTEEGYMCRSHAILCGKITFYMELLFKWYNIDHYLYFEQEGIPDAHSECLECLRV